MQITFKGNNTTMKPVIVQAEQLSKSFIISHEHKEKYTALRDVVASKAKKIFSFPFTLNEKKQNTQEEFWALQNLNFEIRAGERVGIIGRNGAGKSTLLKILSRITEPTSGTVKIKGRVGSLLEVGTGFHPELTGSENIFLNGAILGMSRAEIKAKYDEIVEFAEVEKFLDTPVKRYSSGMYVRLAFAVAAHLEPEILIVDEVLAVGDAQFQKKCLGKMEEVSKGHGRTVLFVSHNMGVITQLCPSAILLNKGKVEYIGESNAAIAKYISLNANLDQYEGLHNDKEYYIEKVEVVDINGNQKNSFVNSDKFCLNINIKKGDINPSAKLSVTIQSKTGEYLSTFVENLEEWFDAGSSSKKFQVVIPGNIIVPGFYAFRLAIFLPAGHVYDLVEMICPVTIIDEGTSMAAFEGYNYGYFFMNHEFKSI